jgi:hypothetical protein
VIHGGKLLEVQFGRFLQVGDRFFDSFALAYGAHFGAFGDVEFGFLCNMAVNVPTGIG